MFWAKGHFFNYAFIIYLSLFIWDGSLANSLPRSPFWVDSHEPHHLLILNDGAASLEARLRLVENAKESILFETFILELDESQRVFLQALVRKAKEGVKVKILLDKPPVYYFLKKQHIAIFEEAGIEFKLYNPLNFLRPLKSQIRNHKKTLSVDGKYAIIGGRNHANSYFSLSPRYNYLDRDLYIEGPLVKEIDRAFMEFWEHKFSRPVKIPKKKNYLKWTAKYRGFFLETPEDRRLRQKIQTVGGALLADSPFGICRNLTFLSDKPGWEGRRDQIVYHALMAEIAKTKHTLRMDTPYFVNLKSEWQYLLERLKNKLSIELFINSYAKVSDSFLTLNYFNSVASWWAKRGLKIFVSTGLKPNDRIALEPRAVNARWGNHSKTFLFDDQAFMISSYNFDPRSKLYSAETAIICRSQPQLMQDMIAEFEKRKEQGLPTNKKGRPPGGYLKDIPWLQRIIYHLQTPFAYIFKPFI